MKTNAIWTAIGLGAAALAALYFTTAAIGEPVPAAPVPDPFAFVRSMEGTRPDGDIKVGAGDQLVVDAELGHLFDYYLAGLGERSMAAIVQEIEHELDRRLKPGPAQQAKRLLASYLAYKRALVDVERALPATNDLLQAARQRLRAMQALRPQYFSAAQSDGLFGASDAYDADALARLQVSMDQRLTAAQRSSALAALDARLTPAQRAERAAPSKVIALEERMQALRADGASEDDIYRARAAATTPEAAARLAEVDRDDAAWKTRIALYLARRGQLQSGGAQPQVLQQLRDAGFTPEEQRRLPAFE
jgi:lipase chaperone LimK